MDLFRKRTMLCDEYENRGKQYEAECAAARSILDYYYELAGTDHPPAGGTEQEWNERVMYFLRNYPGWSKISDSDYSRLCAVAKEEAIHKGFYKIGMPPFYQWLSKLAQKEGETT